MAVHFLFRFALAGAVLALMATAAFAADVQKGARTEPVKFAKGATTTVVSGELKGEQYVDYMVTGGAGQTLAVTLKGSNQQNYFNVTAPGALESMFTGSLSGNQFKRVLPTDGDYTIRVYLMRVAARRNEASDYALNIALEGKTLAPIAATKDAVIRGTPFHASANVSCSRAGAPQTLRCDAYVIRRGFDGTGTVEVSWPGGLRRNILFVKMQPLASDSRETMAFARTGDLTRVSVGNDERMDIPDALLTGG